MEYERDGARLRRWFAGIGFEQRVLLLALLAGASGALVSLCLLWFGDFTPKVRWTLSLFILCTWFGFAYATRGRVVVSLQTLSNLLAALREGDYSFRARITGRSDDAMAEVMREVNAFGSTLKSQRIGAMEATALLRSVMEEIDVAVFAFDAGERLRLVNRAGEELMGRPAGQLLGRTALELGLDEPLRGEPATRHITFPGRSGRWGIRRTSFRQQGLPHELLVLLDLSRPLRQEELHAWQRLVRVLGHELNNSLAPIISIAGSLESLLGREPLPPDWREDMERGLAVIAGRAAALNRFMDAYARLARLPAPRLAPVEVRPLVHRAAALETRMAVEVIDGPHLVVAADGDQLEQLLINLLRNAVDASLATSGKVSIQWDVRDGYLDVRVLDEGEGLAGTTNLFVPFFTTKAGGSGIGLVLSRQIAEAHGGSLALENRADRQGCVARLTVPI